MIDPDLQKQLSEINANLIASKKGPGIWRAFFNGMFGALGYLAGLAIIIGLLGWYLNKIGALPQIQKRYDDFISVMDGAKALMGGQQNQAQQGSAGYEITLPDGQKVKVNP